MRNPVFNRAIFVFALLGLTVAGYLWLAHANAHGQQPIDIPCGGSGDCNTVANSPYARFPFGSGPPVAMYGTLGYIAIAVLSFLRTLPGLPSRDRMLRGLILAGAMVGAAFSLYLTNLEINKIHAICRWCMGSQVIILIIAGLSVADNVVNGSGRRQGKADEAA